MPACIENLEQRSLLSVSAATFAGPQTKGTTWQYQSVEYPAYVDTMKVIGPVALGGVTTTRIHITHNLIPSVYSDQYQTVNSKTGVQLLKEIDAGPGSVETVTTLPQKVQFPKSLAAGQSVTGKFVRHEVESHSGKVTTVDTPYTYTLAIKSETRVRVTTPAGTFSCYVISEKVVNQKLKSGYIQITHYVAPGVGHVKTVQVEVNPGHANVTTTTVLKSFHAGS